MAITGNKGEWSEIYTLLKLLGEGKVYAGDQNLNRIQNLFYPIIMILRQEKEGNYNYKILCHEGQSVPPGNHCLFRLQKMKSYLGFQHLYFLMNLKSYSVSSSL